VQKTRLTEERRGVKSKKVGRYNPFYSMQIRGLLSCLGKKMQLSAFSYYSEQILLTSYKLLFNTLQITDANTNVKSMTLTFSLSLFLSFARIWWDSSYIYGGFKYPIGH